MMNGALIAVAPVVALAEVVTFNCSLTPTAHTTTWLPVAASAREVLPYIVPQVPVANCDTAVDPANWMIPPAALAMIV